MQLYIYTFLFIVIVYFLFKNKSSFSEINFLAVTYETDSNDVQVNNLKRMFKKNGYNYKVLGNGEKWNSWYGRALSYIKFLKSIDPNTYILLCDGRDVVINQNFQKFYTKALFIRNKYGNKIIVGTEEGCCTGNNDPVYRSSKINKNNDPFPIYMNFMKSKATSSLPYLNFGMLYGKASELLNMFNLLNIKKGEDDQALLYKVYYDHPELFYLDFSQDLFSNASHNQNKYSYTPINKSNEELCFFKWNGNEFQNTKTNSFPSIIQTPGKNWHCYRMLAEKLIPNPEFYN